MKREPLSDEQILEALHLRDTGALNTTQLADRFGKSRNAMIGALNRIDRANREHDAEGNQNGSMGPRWWKR